MQASERSFKPRVLICGVLPPPYFGHSMLYEMLMASSFPTEHEVIFLNMHFWSYETNKKVTGGKLIRMAAYYWQYLWLIVTRRPEFVLFNISFYKMPFLKDFIFCATGIVLGRKLVIHDHGQYVRELHEALPGWQKPMLRWMLNRMAASIIMGERVRPMYDGLADQKKLVVVPGTVADTKLLKVMPNRPAPRNVLYFSHMSFPKGIDVAFDTAARVLKAERDVHFTFAGPMENNAVAEGLERLQAEYPGRVRYMGYIEGAAERTALFRGADVFIFPTMRDVFGLVLLHAMAEGIPVVASFEGTIPEIVVDGKTGFLCPKGHADEFAAKVLMLLSDERLRASMAVESRERFEACYALPKYGQWMAEAFSKIRDR